MIKSDSADLSLKMLFDMNLDRVRFETEKTFFTTDGKNAPLMFMERVMSW